MKSTNSKNMKIAMSFLLAAVLLQMVAMKVEGLCDGKECINDSDCANSPPCVCGFFPLVGRFLCCGPYDTPCNPTIKNSCCDGLTCTEVTPGVFKCKEECEDHAGHECYPGLYECCPDSGLACVQVSPNVYQCQ